MRAATLDFDSILAGGRQGGRFAADLRKFLKDHPDHIDGLHHYASTLGSTRKFLEAFAFAETAVGIGLRAFPKEFVFGTDRLPGGYVQNRPFLRALHGLMLAQHAVGLSDGAIATGTRCLELDLEDRMGARFSLPIYVLESGRDRSAVELFERVNLKERFAAVEYVHALALFRLGQHEACRNILAECIRSHSQVARYILEPSEPPEGKSRFGVVWGSPYEAWLYARDFGHLWRSNSKALALLRQEFTLFSKTRTSTN